MTVTHEWVSVKDEARMPHQGTCVWVSIACGGVMRAHLGEDGLWYADTIVLDQLVDVTHWQDMIVPEAPA